MAELSQDLSERSYRTAKEMCSGPTGWPGPWAVQQVRHEIECGRHRGCMLGIAHVLVVEMTVQFPDYGKAVSQRRGPGIDTLQVLHRLPGRGGPENRHVAGGTRVGPSVSIRSRCGFTLAAASVPPATSLITGGGAIPSCVACGARLKPHAHSTRLREDPLPDRRPELLP